MVYCCCRLSRPSKGTSSRSSTQTSGSKEARRRDRPSSSPSPSSSGRSRDARRVFERCEVAFATLWICTCTCSYDCSQLTLWLQGALGPSRNLLFLDRISFRKWGFSRESHLNTLICSRAELVRFHGSRLRFMNGNIILARPPVSRALASATEP